MPTCGYLTAAILPAFRAADAGEKGRERGRDD